MDVVTIIIPTYNRAGKIENTLTSVLMQDYSKIEIIVVDDGSTDATESIVYGIAERNTDANKQIRYVIQPNQGACVARNHGMMLATGKYIMFLDSDDLIKKTMLSKQISKIEAEKTQCSICDFECIDEAGNVIVRFENNRHPHDFIRCFVSPHISTVLMTRESIPPGLHWNPELKTTQDIDFIYKYFVSVQNYSYVNEALFQYCLHGGERISDGYIKGLQYEILIKSFRRYLELNGGFVAINRRSIYMAYRWALLRHQLRNSAARAVPIPVKKVLKKFLKKGKFIY